MANSVYANKGKTDRIRFVAHPKGIAMKFSIQANPVSDLAICLLHSVTNAHILHLQTKSFSEHMALEAFYTEIGDLADGFIEAYQGKYGLLQYPNVYTPPSLPLPYLTYLKDELETLRRKPEFPQDSELQNDLDTIATLIDSTLYKLRFLK